MAPIEQRAAEAIQHWLREKDEEDMIKMFDTNLVPQFRLQLLKSFVDNFKPKGPRNGLIHLLTKHNKSRVLTHLVQVHDFDINAQRQPDGCTALHLACYHKKADSHLARWLIDELGADEGIRNAYGEVASAVPQDQAFKQAITAANSVEKLLQVVQGQLSESPHVQNQDLIHAYHLLSKSSADYDPVYCTYRPDAIRHAKISGDPLFLPLEEALCSFVSASQALPDFEMWPALLGAMVRLPSSALAKAVAQRLRQLDAADLLLREGDGLLLVRLAWHLAKLPSFPDIDRQMALGVFAQRLAGDISRGGLKSVEVSQLLSSYGKALHRHLPLLEAAAEHIIAHIDDFQPQNLSNCAWAMGRLLQDTSDACARAFQAICARAVEIMEDFDDQNVANLLWAMAKLQILDAMAYNALFKRASVTLYNAQARRHHTRQSSLEYVLHWWQNFTAFSFVRSTREPHQSLALEGLSSQYLRDIVEVPQRLKRNYDGHHSFSNGTREHIEDIDAILQTGGDVVDQIQHTDSLEVAAAAASEEVLQANELIADVFLSCSLLSVQRSPHEYREVLQQHPVLAACSKELVEAGFPAEHPSGVKVFVHPREYELVVQHFEAHFDLRNSSIIVTRDFMHAVKEAIKSLPRKYKVGFKPHKQRETKPDEAAERTSEWWGEVQVLVSNSFINLQKLPHAKRSAATV